VASPEALQMGSRLDGHHTSETNGQMSVCRRCGAQTGGPEGLHIQTNDNWSVRCDGWMQSR